jgi:cephalosporin hydroxylase
MFGQTKKQARKTPSTVRPTMSSDNAAPGASYVDKNSFLRITSALIEQRPTPAGLGRRLVSGVMAPFLYESTGSEAEEYHKWYYNTNVWKEATWMGIGCWKSVSDMWNYQEILVDLKPSLVIEFGTNQGGSAVFFASVMRQIGQPFKVLSVDVTHEPLDPKARLDPDVLFVQSRSNVPAIADQIRKLREEHPGPVFAILDSDHSMNHVLDEMKLLRPLLTKGDYLLVEDSMLNGHPNLPGWGPGPYEAIEAYEKEFPNDYTHDVERENKFGFSFAPNGFLIRN